MKAVGGLLRYLLNINTIWGFMILSAFAVCLVQHYQPTTTPIPAHLFQEGATSLTIRVTDRKDQFRAFNYELMPAPDCLIIASDERTPRKDRPWLISAERRGAVFLLTWDHADPGRYELAVGSQVIARGRLVTLQSLTDAAFDYATKGFEIALGLVAAMVLFLGLMKVGEDAGIVQLVARALHPVIRLLFPGVPKDHPASGAILMNVTTTVLGLGNAATPFGIKAMKELQSLNPHPDVASDSQVMLLAYNTAGFALLPTTLLALRKSAGCSDPFEIIGTCMFAGAVSTIVAILAARLLGRLPFFSLMAAVTEQQRDQQRAAAPAAASSATLTGSPDPATQERQP